MSSIRRLAHGGWQARYRDPSGRQRAKNFRRRSDAEKHLSIVEADKLRGLWTDPQLSRLTLEEWAARWFGTLSHLKPWTRATYGSLLRAHIVPAFGPVQLGRIDQIGVQEWVSDMTAGGLSASRVRQAHQVLRAALEAAVSSGYLARNPARGVKLPRDVRREMLFLDGQQVERLAAGAGEYGTLVYTLAYGGLRWGEVAALRRSRCDLLRSRVEVVDSLAEIGGQIHLGPTKTYQRRTVVLPRFLIEQLAGVLADCEPEGFVFTSPTGSPLRISNFARRVWRPAVEAAGLDPALRIHDLRHTCAALLIAQGAHPKAIQAHLGHSSITVTLDRYGHLFPYQFEELAARLDEARERAVVDYLWTPAGGAVVSLPSARPKIGS